jgi:hypothetical protein
MYHNTPETQTDESYTHPEDLEHFAHHEEIERKEAEKEAAFEGITVEEALAQHEHDGEPRSQQTQASQDGEQTSLPLEGADSSTPEHPHDDQKASQKPSIPQYTRAEKGDPVQKFLNAKQGSDAQNDWGQGDSGYKSPRSPSEKMRKNVPYKARCLYLRALRETLTNTQDRMQYKFKRSWGDF